ncbi:MAG: hypothetical protein ACE5LB_04095, partial [Acidiferrobacterales bacterium]
MSPQDPTDRAFDRYLKGKSALSDVYKEAAIETPPAELDAAILAEAGREARTRPRTIGGPFVSNWIFPVSLAAVLILTVGLVTFVFEEGGMPWSPDETPPVPSERDGLLRPQGTITPEAEKAPAGPVMRKRAAPAKRKHHVTSEPTATMEPAAQMPAAEDKRAGESANEGAVQPSVPAVPAPLMETKEQVREEEPQRQLHKAGRADELAPASATTTRTEELSPEEWLKRIAELRKQG